MEARFSDASARTVLVAMLATVAGIGMVDALMRVPLGHDEAAYGLLARHLLDSAAETTGAPSYRSVGMAYLALPAVLAGGSELAFRLVALFWTLAALVGMARAGRSLLGAWPAVMATVGLATGWSFLRRATELLSDLPSSALIISAMAVIATELRRSGGPRWRILGAGVLAAAAFYVRYGSILMLVAVAVMAVVVWPQRCKVGLVKLAATAGLFIALLSPHFAESIGQFETPWGLLLHAREAHAHAFIGRGFLLYLTKGYELGLVCALLAGWGIWRGARAWRWRSPDNAVQRFVVAVALSHLFVLGLRGWSEPRYVFADLFLLGLVAGQHLVECWGGWSRAVRRAVVATVLVNFAVCAAINLEVSRRRELDRRVIVRVGELIRGRSSSPCLVYTTRLPQLTWYSGCRAEGHRGLRSEMDTDRRRFAVFFEDDREPAPFRARWQQGLPPAALLPSPGLHVGDAHVHELSPTASASVPEPAR